MNEISNKVKQNQSKLEQYVKCICACECMLLIALVAWLHCGTNVSWRGKCMTLVIIKAQHNYKSLWPAI